MYIQDLRHELATVRFELRDVRNELLFVKLQAASSSDGGDAGGPNGKKTANKQRKRSAFDLYLGARRMPTIPASELFNWTAVDESIHFGTDEERLAVHQVLGAFHEKPCCVRDAEFLIRYAAATYLLGQAEVYGAGPDGKLRKRTSAGEEARLKIITVANATIYRAVEVAPQNGRAQCWCDRNQLYNRNRTIIYTLVLCLKHNGTFLHIFVFVFTLNNCYLLLLETESDTVQGQSEHYTDTSYIL